MARRGAWGAALKRRCGDAPPSQSSSRPSRVGPSRRTRTSTSQLVSGFPRFFSISRRIAGALRTKTGKVHALKMAAARAISNVVLLCGAHSATSSGSESAPRRRWVETHAEQ